MRRSTILIATIIILIATIAIALIAAENAQYANPITVQSNGVATVTTTQGDQAFTDIEYIKGSIVSLKITGYNGSSASTPVTLPNTSAPHGTHTCDMGSFTVTTDQACDDLK